MCLPKSGFSGVSFVGRGKKEKRAKKADHRRVTPEPCGAPLSAPLLQQAHAAPRAISPLARRPRP